MSGGSYNYLYSKLDEFGYLANQLEGMATRCRSWALPGNSKEKWDRASNKWLPATPEDRLNIIARAELLEAAAAKYRAAMIEVKALEEIIHDVEWVASGDCGVDHLMKPLTK